MDREKSWLRGRQVRDAGDDTEDQKRNDECAPGKPGRGGCIVEGGNAARGGVVGGALRRRRGVRCRAGLDLQVDVDVDVLIRAPAIAVVVAAATAVLIQLDGRVESDIAPGRRRDTGVRARVLKAGVEPTRARRRRIRHERQRDRRELVLRMVGVGVRIVLGVVALVVVVFGGSANGCGGLVTSAPAWCSVGGGDAY